MRHMIKPLFALDTVICCFERTIICPVDDYIIVDKGQSALYPSSIDEQLNLAVTFLLDLLFDFVLKQGKNK